jgi:hypothetical protein
MANGKGDSGPVPIDILYRRIETLGAPTLRHVQLLTAFYATDADDLLDMLQALGLDRRFDDG